MFMIGFYFVAYGPVGFSNRNKATYQYIKDVPHFIMGFHLSLYPKNRFNLLNTKKQAKFYDG